jgi:hypothetical protein
MKAGGRRQKAEGSRNPICNEDLDSPLPKLFALKGKVLYPIVLIKVIGCSEKRSVLSSSIV